MMFYVYEIVCLSNGKRYIGKATDVKARWQEHLRAARTLTKNSFIIHRAIAKHKQDNFQFNILFEFEIEQDALDKEIELIAFYKTNIHKYGNNYGYNLTDGGDGISGHIHSEKTKQQISSMRMGIIFSKETIEKMRDAKIGRKLTDEHKRHIAEAGIGRMQSDASKFKTAQAKLGSKNPAAKLTENQVLEIKQLIIDNVHTSYIATQYNVAPRTIRDIKNNKCWKHIKI
jgi:group I intron endonuclease